MVIYASGGFSCEVEVGVVGEAERGGGIGSGLVVDNEGVVACERVGDVEGEIAGVAVITIRAEAGEKQGGVAGGCGEGCRLPELFIEAALATVQMVGRVVDSELHLASVEQKPAVSDPAGNAPRDASEIVVPGEVVLEGWETQDDICLGACAVRDHESGDDASVGDDVGLDACGAFEGEFLDGLSVG